MIPMTRPMCSGAPYPEMRMRYGCRVIVTGTIISATAPTMRR